MSSRLSRFAPYLPLLLALAGSLAYWPGLVTWDSLRQYDQALSGDFDDWHPPVMEWIWRQLLPLSHSPAPMLVFQLSLYLIGFCTLIELVRRRYGAGRAFALGCIALLPIPVALLATIIKDSLMMGPLLMAAGLSGFVERKAMPEAMKALARIAALAACLFVATLRFNAFLAALPLALWALPPALRATRGRTLASAAILLPLLLAAMPVANRLVGARSSDVELSLIIFDLGGITEHSGENQFPPLGLTDPVAVNHRCYTPARWDSYSWWVDPCPINFEGVRQSFRQHHINPRLFWLGAIARHPLAYAEHRLAHWRINARFFVRDDEDRPVQVEAPPNDWGFAVTPNPLLRTVDAAALESARTPLGWPWAWMVAMVLVLATTLRKAKMSMVHALAWSALLYGLGYGALSVASDLRYYLWTMVAGAIVLVLGVWRPSYRRG
jgi:hypothetical protein